LGKTIKNLFLKQLAEKILYLFKVKGKTKIPDYVQIRDEAYTLLAYFRADRPEKALIKYGFESRMDEIIAFIQSMPFGKMIKLELT
jgi:hypothetical protein